MNTKCDFHEQEKLNFGLPSSLFTDIVLIKPMVMKKKICYLGTSTPHTGQRCILAAELVDINY